MSQPGQRLPDDQVEHLSMSLSESDGLRRDFEGFQENGVSSTTIELLPPGACKWSARSAGERAPRMSEPSQGTAETLPKNKIPWDVPERDSKRRASAAEIVELAEDAQAHNGARGDDVRDSRCAKHRAGFRWCETKAVMTTLQPRVSWTNVIHTYESGDLSSRYKFCVWPVKVRQRRSHTYVGPDSRKLIFIIS